MAERIQSKIESIFYEEQLQGRTHLNNSAFEVALQAFTNCLHMCERWRGLSHLKYEVLGNIGWINRLMGRYEMAIQNLQEALELSASDPPTFERVQIETELGTVYRLIDRHDEARAVFKQQYSLAKKQLTASEKEGDAEEAYSWKRVACRAVGNLGMANYQRALHLMSEAKGPNNGDVKRKAKDLIQQAMTELHERIRLAEEIGLETPHGGSHGYDSRLNQAICWRCIGYSRLSLCHSALADLELSEDDKMMHLKKAVEISEHGTRLALYGSVLTLSQFFHGRALLQWAKHQQTTTPSDSDSYVPEAWKEKVLRYFGSRAILASGEPGYRIVTPAIALAMEPSTEHRGYLRELVEAGADFESADPHTGYTALDYAVFSGDVETQEIIIDGLRKQHRVRTGKSLPKRTIESWKQEARLKKGYREIFQERLRPTLMKAGQEVRRWEEDDEQKAKNRAIRHRALQQLRRVYAATLEADKEMGRMFDRLKVVTFADFLEFGRLPRSSDGLAKPFDMAVRDGPGSEGNDKDEGEVVIFFSYRWINTDPNRDSPDDANGTQYKRMIDAVNSYVTGQNGLISSDKVLIWMDFACVDQDDPSAGVSALPLLISQCDAVITLKDDTYLDRAWCCVEADMIQTLRDQYYLHEWFEQVPYTTQETQDNSGGSLRDGNDQNTSKGGDGVTEWQLRSVNDWYSLNTGDKKLSHETDRPKILFLERQTSLLRWSPG
ncbi:hypothetical protein V8F20_011524 [Naviculisporaceae sp. PSN 640]